MRNTITKVSYILSYSQPNYVRSTALLSMLEMMDDVKVITAINKSKNILRYVETLITLIKTRIIDRPDVYILGFRGYEIFWPVRILTIGKPLIFDEFINPYMWFIEEHHKFKKRGLLAEAIKLYSKSMLLASDHILCDTELQIDYSSQNFKINSKKFSSIYVGTDENNFTSKDTKSHNTKELNVFFYGTFLPLHGVDVILEAARKLSGYPIKIVIVGKSKNRQTKQKFDKKIKLSKDNVIYKEWVDYKELPAYIESSDLCLGGPFGGTMQGKKVITGKTFQFLLMGKPVVIGRITGDHGFVDKQNCLLVDQNNSTILAETIKWASEHREEIEKIGLSGQKLYQKKFSNRAQKEKLHQLILDIT